MSFRQLAILAALLSWQLAEQGVRLVDASEVAEWLRDEVHGGASASRPFFATVADAFLARFGGGDEG